MIKHSNIQNNLVPAALVQKTIELGQGKLSSDGALVVNTGKFTGRSPKDRYIVEDDYTRDSIDWGEVNIPINQDSYADLYKKMMDYVSSLDEIYARDAYACASNKYRCNIKVYTEYPWQNLFAYNMFLRPSQDELKTSLRIGRYMPFLALKLKVKNMAQGRIISRLSISVRRQFLLEVQPTLVKLRKGYSLC